MVVRTLPLVFLQDGPYVVGQGACYGPCEAARRLSKCLLTCWWLRRARRGRTKAAGSALSRSPAIGCRVVMASAGHMVVRAATS